MKAPAITQRETLYEYFSNLFFSTDLPTEYVKQYKKIKEQFGINNIQSILNKLIIDKNTTPLFLDLESEKFKFLIGENLDLNIDFINKKEKNALFFQKNSEIIDYIFEKGNAIISMSKNSKDFFNYCCFYTFKCFLNKNYQIKDQEINKILFNNNDLELIDYLFKNNMVNEKNLYDTNGCSPIFFSDNLDKIQLLLDYGVDINHKNKIGANASLYTEKLKTIKFLEKNGIDLYNTILNSNDHINILSLNPTIITILQISRDKDSVKDVKSKIDKFKSQVNFQTNYYNVILSEDKFKYLFVDKKIPILKKDEFSYLYNDYISPYIYKYIDLNSFIKNNEDNVLNHYNIYITNRLLKKAVNENGYVFNKSNLDDYKNTKFYLTQKPIFEQLFIFSKTIKKVDNIEDNKNNKVTIPYSL